MGEVVSSRPRVLLSRGLAFLLLPGLVLVAYANSLNGEFVFDDRVVVVENTQLINVRSLDDALAVGSGWRRLTEMTYGLNFYWGQLDPFGYHLVNVGIHAVNAILVYLIILQIAGQLYPALAGAALFTVHPLLSEAVANVAGRASLLCALFYFLAIFAFLKALDSDRPSPRISWWVLAALAAVVAWQAKQEAIALPVAMAGLVWIRRERNSWRYLLPLSIIPIGLVVLIRDQLAGLYAAVTENRGLVSAGFEEVLPFAIYVRTYVSAIVGYYFPRFVYPTHLSADPYIRPAIHWYTPEFLLAIVVLGALGWMLVRPKTSAPLVGAGLALLLLSPLTAYAALPLADVVFEHRVYIPGLGAAVLSAALLNWLRKRYGDVAPAASLVVVLTFTIMTIQRNSVWANSMALWEDAESKSPEKPRTHFNLAEAYQLAGRLPEALREYRHALEIKPDIHAAYSNMAAILLDRGQFDEAEEVLLRVTELAPDFTDGFVNLAVLYLRRSDPDRALEAVNRALTINAESVPAHLNKGDALTLKGEYALAVESYERAASLRPDVSLSQLKLGLAYDRLGDREAAERQFRALLESAVAAEAYRNLGVLYARAADDDRALEYLLEATRLRPRDPDAHHDLGAIYLRKEMTGRAIEEFETAIYQRPDYGSAHLNMAEAYHMGGDPGKAIDVLESYIREYRSTGSPYLAEAREKLQLWQ